MPMLFLLVCSGAVFWGVTNILRKHFLRDRQVGVEVMVVATMLGASMFSFGANFILFGTPEISTGFWWPFAITTIITIIFVYGEVLALKLEDVSIVSALLGITPIFVILTSWLLLREFPTFYGLIGIGLIVLGTYFLNLKGFNVKLPTKLEKIIPQKFHQPTLFFSAPLLRLFSSKGAIIALFIAIIAAISLNFDKQVVLNSNPAMRAASVFLVVAIVVYGVSIVRGRWQKLDKTYFWPIFGIGLLLGLANILMDSGYLYGIVPYVGALKRTQVLWTVIFAGIFLKEKHTVLRLGAAAIIVSGIILLAF